MTTIPTAPVLQSPRGRSMSSLSANGGEQVTHYDEHAVDVSELERRLSTSRQSGLTSQLVSQIQSERPQLNLLPLDADVGHGGIHELVGVLRDGSWIHTRAENLLPGDVIALKEGQSVPADVRLVECHDMWVDQSVLLGKRAAEPRVAATNSVFDAAEPAVPYMEAQNMAFYGTTVTRGHGRAIVVRTGEDTVLGTISSALLRKRKSSAKRGEVPLTESLKQQFEFVFCRNDMLPAAIHRVSALVVEHSDVVKRTVISASFGVNPTVIIELEDLVLANETSADELEREIALQMTNYCQDSEDAAVFTKALAACRHRIESASMVGAGSSNSDSSNGGASASNAPRVPSLPASSPIAAPVVVDPIRDQNAVLRFCAQFGANSPRNTSAAGRKTRYSTLLHAQISGCEVYVHFDDECGAHVVLLQGPAREILSRCGKVRRGGSSAEETMAPLETSDLQKIQDMVMDLEARNETVVSFAELYLDPELYPVGVKFDIENFNFPTSNMCYLGSLGLVEKLQPEVVLMGSFARAADVRLFIPTTDMEFAVDDAPYILEEDDDIVPNDEDEDDIDGEGAGGRVRCVYKIPVRLREASTGEVMDVDACVFRSSVLSISNTLNQWRQVLSQHAIVIFDGCSPAQVDLLVETLQDLGECVGLVASGSANALAIAAADVGFAVPAQEVIDLSEEAADVVLSSATCPRSDAIRLIDAAKKSALAATSPRGLGSADISAAHRVAPLPSASKAKSVVVNLLRESVSAGRMLGLSEADLKVCFDAALAGTLGLSCLSCCRMLLTQALAIDSLPPAALNSPRSNPVAPSAIPPLSPSKFPPSAFRSSGLVLSASDEVAHISSI